MLNGPFLPTNWLGACENLSEARVLMLGMPFDSTVSNKAGSRFAPGAMRAESIGMETYSPTFDKHLEDVNFFDAGDLELPFGNPQRALDIIEQNTTQALELGKKVLGIGGEHLVTLGTFKAYLKHFKNLALIHFDAHTDLRDEFLGEELSHACVIKKIANLIGMENILQIGIRSGLKEEFKLMKQHNSLIFNPTQLERFKDKNLFVTIDLDVLDPSIMPGTGTPEAGGLTYKELLNWIVALKNYNIVGADVVELAPEYDPSKASTATACKVIREVLMIM